ncbi:hypothetical protein [Stutzerimonas nitrititolerans]|uniref:hypothetical protein n=1 Tax=Stutzerimonas nitrititolerans TaxID=2482751 RepID=UPI00289E4DAC|nr:hypothetical protein [Stutzerimonas nitrititolerans]
MAWPTTRRPSTKDLLRVEHRLQAAPSAGAGRWIILALVAVIVALLYQRSHEQAGHGRQIDALKEERVLLQAALDLNRLKQQETQATEEQLLKRIATLSAQVERLQTDLAFFRQQKKTR